MEMIEESIKTKAGPLRLHAQSSIRDDVWHRDHQAGAYEWWYFDAISDDGRDALVIIFLANFVFSPRYNRAVAESSRGTGLTPPPANFPAVAVALYRDGRPLVRSISEYRSEEFTARTDHPACCIGHSCFRLEQDSREARYLVTLNAPSRRGRRLEGQFEWLVRSGDFNADESRNVNLTDQADTAAHEWNLVAPRCDVSGTLDVVEPGGKTVKHAFRGSGYHDHNRDRRPLPVTIAEWQWGRAHFDDITAVFYRYREVSEQESTTRLFIVRNDELQVHKAQFKIKNARRHHFGLRYARDLQIAAEGEGRLCANFKLHLRQHFVDSSFFYLRFVSDALLDAGDGRTRRATAITEHLAPRALRWRWLWWLTDMRIGRNDQASFLP